MKINSKFKSNIFFCSIIREWVAVLSSYRDEANGHTNIDFAIYKSSEGFGIEKNWNRNRRVRDRLDPRLKRCRPFQWPNADCLTWWSFNLPEGNTKVFFSASLSHHSQSIIRRFFNRKCPSKLYTSYLPTYHSVVQK